jgi:uridine kinase
VNRPVESPEEVAPADAILLFHGIFLHRPELIDHWDLSIFVEVPIETGARRAQGRDNVMDVSNASREHLYRHRYMPAQRRYLETVRPRERADAVFVNEHPRAELSMRRGIG